MNHTLEIGQKIGHWTVLDLTPNYTNGGGIRVKCQCDCGTITYVRRSSLTSGKTLQCTDCKRKSRRIYLEIGSTYKDWTIVDGPFIRHSALYYKCKCKCGREQLMRNTHITNPNRWFRCKSCSSYITQEQVNVSKGKVGDLTLSKFGSIKLKAKNRDIPFNLSQSYLWNLYIKQSKICSITGDSIPNINEASLDRIDSSKGYVEGNVQWVTKQANLSKHIMSMEELYEFCRKVLNHANQQPSQPLTKLEGSETNS